MGEPIVPTKSTQCKSGVSIVSKEGLWGLKGPDGSILVEPKFEAISCFRRGIAWVPDTAKNAWCPIGPDGKARNKPDCLPIYSEVEVSHHYQDKLDPDPFRSSVLWMQLKARFRPFASSTTAYWRRDTRPRLDLRDLQRDYWL
nr:WG repeat-containing protein [Rhizobium leguminosarum]